LDRKIQKKKRQSNMGQVGCEKKKEEREIVKKD
jgi:hypothetical protein